MPRHALFALSLIAAAPLALAGECEDNFKKSGSPFSGTDFSSVVTVAAVRPSPTVASPMFCTSTIRAPVRMMGSASGTSTCQRC